MSSDSSNAVRELNKPAKKSRTVCITKKTKKRIEIDDDVLRRFLIRPEIGDKPIAIISIVGEMRKGKSTLMNFFARFFQKKRAANWMDGEDELLGKDFKTLGGYERCTEGILILDQVFEIPMENGEKIAVLLMDTQGLFDHETTRTVNKTLLSLSTLLSSVQIFNVQGVINTQHLDYLKTCMDFAVAAADKAGYMKLQSLVFLMRDSGKNKDGKRGFDAGETMLKKILGSQQGSQLGITKRLKTDFTDVKCFAMAHPGRVTTDYDFDGKLRDFQKEFLDEVKVFVENMADPKSLHPKCTSEKTMKARDLLYMITSCDKIFAEEVFEAPSMMEANEKAYYSVRYEKAYAKYMEEMETYLKQKTDIAEKLLEEKHSEVKEMALKTYDDSLTLGDENIKSNYRQHLVESCDRLCKDMKERLREQLEEKRKRARHATELASLAYENRMKNFCVEKELFVKEHNRHLRAICNAFKDRVDEKTLTSKIREIHDRLVRENEKQRNEFEHKKKEETRLMRFVYVDLRVQCMQEWEKLQISHEILDPAFIKGASIGIEKFAVESYWQKALTPDQLRYKKKQKKMMKKVRRSQIQHYQPVPYSVSSFLSGDEGDNDEDDIEEYYSAVEESSDPDERCSAQKLSDLVGRLVNEFKKLLKEKLSTSKRGEDLLKIATDLEKETEDKFLNGCSPHLLTYHKQVIVMLNHLLKDVQKRNEELWEEKQLEIRIAVAKWISEAEYELRKVMTDRHLDEAALEQFYADLEKPEAFGMLKSIREKEKADKIMKQILADSYRKMRKENASNQQMRPIQNSTELPDTKAWYKRFIRWLKKKFSFA